MKQLEAIFPYRPDKSHSKFPRITGSTISASLRQNDDHFYVVVPEDQIADEGCDFVQVKRGGEYFLFEVSRKRVACLSDNGPHKFGRWKLSHNTKVCAEQDESCRNEYSIRQEDWGFLRAIKHNWTPMEHFERIAKVAYRPSPLPSWIKQIIQDPTSNWEQIWDLAEIFSKAVKAEDNLEQVGEIAEALLNRSPEHSPLAALMEDAKAERGGTTRRAANEIVRDISFAAEICGVKTTSEKHLIPK